VKIKVVKYCRRFITRNHDFIQYNLFIFQFSHSLSEVSLVSFALNENSQ